MSRWPAAVLRPDEVGICEINDERGIVFGHRRRQQQRPSPVDRSQQPGKIAGVLEEQALGGRSVRLDAAKRVEDGKGLAVLEHAPSMVRAQRGAGYSGRHGRPHVT